MRKIIIVLLCVFVLIVSLLSGCSSQESVVAEQLKEVAPQIVVDDGNDTESAAVTEPEPEVAPTPTSKVNYAVSITVDSASFSKCVPGTYSNPGGWTVVAQGTMTSNLDYSEEYRPPTASFSPISHDPIIDLTHGIEGNNLDCGEWKE